MNYNLNKIDLKRSSDKNSISKGLFSMLKWNYFLQSSYGSYFSLVCALLSTFLFNFLGFFGSIFTLTRILDDPVVATAWVGPVWEEVFRFTVFGGPMLWFEIICKINMVIFYAIMGDYSFIPRTIPSLCGHLLFFYIDVPLDKRILIHFLWNYYVMSQNTGAINYELYQMNAVGSFRMWCRTINLFASKLLIKQYTKVKKAYKRRQYRRRRAAKKLIPKPLPWAKRNPNMAFYVKVKLETQSYLEVASRPASKCKLIPLSLHQDLLFKSRVEMRDAKKKKAKNERSIRKALSKQAREIAMKNRILAAAEKARRTGVWPVVDVNRVEVLPPRSESDIKEKALERAKVMLRYRDVLQEMRYAPPLRPTIALDKAQQLLVDKLLVLILSGGSKTKITKAVHRLTKTLTPAHAELAESLKGFAGIKLDKQMFSAISGLLPSMPSGVPVTHALHEHDRASLDALITKFSGLADHVSASPLLTKGKVDVGLDVKSFMTCTGLVLGATIVAYLLYKNPGNLAGMALKALLTALAVYYATPMLEKCLSDAFDSFLECRLRTETDEGHSTVDEVPLDTHSAGTTLYSIAGPLITWCHFAQTGDLKDKSVIETFLQTSSMAEKAQKAVVFSTTTFLTFMTELFSWIGDSLGWTGLSKVFDLYPELSELETNVKELEAKLHAGTIFPDRRMAIQVAEYRDRIVKIVSKLKPGSAAAIRAGFLVKATDVLYKTTAIGHAQNAVRAEPVCMNLYSPPGVGKSTLVISFAHELLAQPGVLDKTTRQAFARQRDNFVYYIDATQNYPDGYYSQLVTVLDDWAIRKDVAGAETDTGLTALIRWVNGLPYNVESAHLELKGKIFAANIFMLATTNCRQVDPENFPGFTEVKAVIRRLHMSYMLSIADEFCEDKKIAYEHRKIRSDIVKYAQVRNPKTGVEENVQVLPYEAWLFVPWDIARGSQAYGPDGKVLPNKKYDEVMAEAVNRITKSRTFNSVHKATIDQRVASALARAAALDEERERAAPLEAQVLGSEYHFDASRFDARLQATWDKYPWLRDVFEKYVRGRCGLAAEEVIRDDNQFVHFTEVLTRPGFDPNVAQDMLASHPVDWNMFSVALRDGPHRSALDCVSYTITTSVQTSLDKLKSIWNSISTWVSDNKTHVFMGMLALVAGAGLYALYNWVESSFFQGTVPESLQPKVNKTPLRNRSVLRTQLPKGAVKVDLVKESGCAVNLKDIANVVNNNRFEISLSDKPEFRQCSALGIYNRYLVLPRHMITEFHDASELDPALKITFKRARADTGFVFSMTYKDIKEGEMLIDFPENHGKTEDDRYNDRVIIKIPECLMQNLPDIRKHLVSVHDKMWTQKEIKGTVNLVSTTKTGRIIEQFWDTGFKLDHKVEHQDDMSIINGLFYSQETAKGDCGSPLFASAAGSAKFIGFHIAGNSSYRIAVGIAIRKEDFDFLAETPSFVDRDIPLESMCLEGREDVAHLAGSGRIVAKLEKPIYQPTHSCLVKAPFHDVLEPCGLVRSALRPKMVGDVLVDPLPLGLKNYNRDRVLFPVQHMEENKYSAITEAVASGCVGNRRLTYEEAVHGNDEMDGIPKDTSLGIPMIEWVTPQYKGKTIVMGRGEEKRGPKWDEAKAAYDDMRTKILAGENPTLLLKAMIKDELLPKEKVDKANSRITFTAPFLLQVFTREQYGDLSKNIMKKENIVRNRQALGLNVYAEWDELAQYLLKFGSKRMLDFDYRKYDGSLGRQILNLVFDILDALCPFSSEEDKKIKLWIRAQTLNAYVAHGGVVVEFDGSNTSGNSLTTIINNFANQLLTMFVLSTYTLKKQGREFEPGLIDWPALCAQVRMCTLGDDVIMALGALFDEITTKDFAEILRPYNIDITNGDKTDPVLFPKGLRDLSFVTFLKRAFRLERGRYVAPLAFSSICKMIQWKDKDVSDDDYNEIVKNALLEVAIHGRETYNKCRAEILPRMIERGVMPHGADWAADFQLALKLTHSWQG